MNSAADGVAVVGLIVGLMLALIVVLVRRVTQAQEQLYNVWDLVWLLKDALEKLAPCTCRDGALEADSECPRCAILKRLEEK